MPGLLTSTMEAMVAPRKMSRDRRRVCGGLAISSDATITDVPLPDIHSYSNPGVSRVRHVELDLAVSFSEKKLRGAATLSLEPAGKTLVLDTRDLVIQRVNGASSGFTVGARDQFLGAPLTIELPAGARSVLIEYETAPAATGLQWLEPAQTAGKRHPFLFSQSQAIHARSWMPVQDSPGVRVTYSARIHAPLPLKALMSARTVRDGHFHQASRSRRT